MHWTMKALYPSMRYSQSPYQISKILLSFELLSGDEFHSLNHAWCKVFPFCYNLEFSEGKTGG